MTAPTLAAPPTLPRCQCGHFRGLHTLTERAPRRRTWCTAWDDGAKCACATYRPAVGTC